MTHVSSAVVPSLQGQTAKPIAPKTNLIKNIFNLKMVNCEVVFGSPSMNCNGTGICRITGTNSIQPLSLKKDCRITLGQIAASPNGKVSLFFFREFLCVQLYRHHFHKGVLTMKEDCPLPKELANALNIKGKKLQSGNYAIVECQGYYRVDITCA